MLERRYRRLLLAYPGAYRRGHGAEIVGTLLEMADDGQTRPTAADSWHLIGSGLRQRFRLPARPLVWLAAVVITLVGGAFGAAAGSWAAEQTFTDLPGDARVEALTRQVAGGGNEFAMDRSGSPWWTETASAGVDQPGWTPEAARERLDGWRLTEISALAGASYTSDPRTGATIEVPTRGSAFEATRSGLLLRISGHVSQDHGVVSVDFWPADTGAMRPAVVVGALAGLAAGWLLVAAGAYRLRRSSPARSRAVVLLTSSALAAVALPAYAFWVNVWRVFKPGDHLVFTVHSALSAQPYWSFGTPWMAEFALAGLALGAAAWAATAGGTPVLRGNDVPAS